MVVWRVPVAGPSPIAGAGQAITGSYAAAPRTTGGGCPALACVRIDDSRS